MRIFQEIAAAALAIIIRGVCFLGGTALIGMVFPAVKITPSQSGLLFLGLTFIMVGVYPVSYFKDK